MQATKWRGRVQVAKIARVVECKSHQTGWNEQRETEVRTTYQPTAAWISWISGDRCGRAGFNRRDSKSMAPEAYHRLKMVMASAAPGSIIDSSRTKVAVSDVEAVRAPANLDTRVLEESLHAAGIDQNLIDR